MSNPYKRVAENHSNIQMLIGSDKVSHQLDSPEMKSVKVNLLSTFRTSSRYFQHGLRNALPLLSLSQFQDWSPGHQKRKTMEITVEFHFLRTRHLNDPNDHPTYYFTNTESFFIPPLKKKTKGPYPVTRAFSL